MAWKLVEQCWRIRNEKFEQLRDYLSGGNCLILRPVAVLKVRRQPSRCAPETDPAKWPLDPNRFQLDWPHR
jgi:hypothetical protein